MALALHPQSVLRTRSAQVARAAQAAHRRSYVYARRRAVVAVVVGLAVGGGLFARGAVASDAPRGGIEMPRTIVAVQGDTLWAIAHRLAPKGNVMDLVDRLVELNGAEIVAGQVIRVP